jgi:hypothetical protein
MRKPAFETAKSTDLAPSRDELNLAEFPFCLLTDRTYRGRNSIMIEREVRDPATGRLARQQWTATGNEKGLPTATDMDVYVALMQIAARDGIDKDRRIHFSRHELVKMQRRTPCQPMYERLKRSLERLVGVTIYAEEAFIDAKTGRRRTCQGFGILDTFRMEDCRFKMREPGPGGEQLEFHFHRSWVVLNDVLYEQLKNNGFKNLDTEVYYDLKLPVSRRLFRFLTRVRERNAASYEIELSHLARLMPLHDLRSSRQLRDLGKAHDELARVGYLDRVERVAGKDGIRLVYAFAETKLDARAEALVARGMTREVARRLVERFPDRVVAKIEAFDRLAGEKKIGNPAGWLRRAIEEDYREAPRPAPKPEPPKRAAAPERRLKLALDELYTKLDPTVQREIDRKAEARARAELGDRTLTGALFELKVLRAREDILKQEYSCELTRVG